VGGARLERATSLLVRSFDLYLSVRFWLYSVVAGASMELHVAAR
jgi:hypothetical protein